MWCFISSAALAAGPINGNFTDGLNNWTVDNIVPGTVVGSVSEGTNVSDSGNTSNVNFPSAPNALLLKGGVASQLTAAGITSDPFLVTHAEIGLRHRSEVQDVEVVGRFRLNGAEVSADEVPPLSQGNQFGTHTFDVQALCGSEVTFQLVQWSVSDNVRNYTLIDDIEVDGARCGAYIDGDLDGFCPFGIDNDDDGDCDGPDEARPTSGLMADCDDSEESIYPGAPETEDDGVDQDCDGGDLTGNCYEDLDRDGFGSAVQVTSNGCDGDQQSRLNNDCDDGAPLVFPGAGEMEVDGVDQDCDGFELCYMDGDGDGFGTVLILGSLDCDGANEAVVAGDCDDGRSGAFPGAPEQCNGLDDDCDEVADPGSPMVVFPDDDGDGFGAGVSQQVCGASDGFVGNDEDCDDDDPAIHPNATEIPGDLVDSDCSGTELCFSDLDGDGAAGETTVDTALDCLGFFTEVTDCDDTLASVSPGAVERPADGIDQDCDGEEACYADLDEDGFGSGTLVPSVDLACTDLGESSIDTDCDDSVFGINPAAEEVLDNLIDEDCDGVAGVSPLPGPGPVTGPADVIYRGSGACSALPAMGLWWSPLLLAPLLRRRSR